MRIIGCDLHTTKQRIAVLDRDSGEITEQTLSHDGETVRDFYAAIPKPAVVGIEATGSMGWFVRLMEELGLTCHVGHPAAIRPADPRRQKNDRRDAQLLLRLLLEDRFPAIWMPTAEQRDLRALLLHRHQWVRMRTRVQHALQAIALGQGIRRGATRWSSDGQAVLAAPATCHRSARRPAGPLSAVGGARDGARCARARHRRAAIGCHVAHDSPGRRSRHRIGHRRLPRRPVPIFQWESASELRRADPQ